jgi:hypothetical protein
VIECYDSVRNGCSRKVGVEQDVLMEKQLPIFLYFSVFFYGAAAL